MVLLYEHYQAEIGRLPVWGDRQSAGMCDIPLTIDRHRAEPVTHDKVVMQGAALIFASVNGRL
jgi:hypothetical protein